MTREAQAGSHLIQAQGREAGYRIPGQIDRIQLNMREVMQPAHQMLYIKPSATPQSLEDNQHMCMAGPNRSKHSPSASLAACFEEVVSRKCMQAGSHCGCLAQRLWNGGDIVHPKHYSIRSALLAAVDE